jgi:hypothetical protein
MTNTIENIVDILIDKITIKVDKVSVRKELIQTACDYMSTQTPDDRIRLLDIISYAYKLSVEDVSKFARSLNVCKSEIEKGLKIMQEKMKNKEKRNDTSNN